MATFVKRLGTPLMRSKAEQFRRLYFYFGVSELIRYHQLQL